MSPAFASSVGVAAYLALFAIVGLLFVFANLLIGRFVRASNPSAEKQETYECGEPAIGSSYIQYDLRFYVVALLFIIFDVEVAFFFPWATVFGKTTNMADERLEVVSTVDGEVALTKEAELLYRELGVRNPTVPATVPATLRGKVDVDAADEKVIKAGIIKESSKQLAWLTIIDICVFFAVLLVGFAYVWKRGDLDWVRAVDRDRARGEAEGSPGTPNLMGEQALSP